MTVPEIIAEAARTGRPVRLRTEDEVLVARVLGYDELRVVYAPLQSSRPERYAVCDSTGFALAIDRITAVRLLDPPADSWA